MDAAHIAMHSGALAFLDAFPYDALEGSTLVSFAAPRFDVFLRRGELDAAGKLVKPEDAPQAGLRQPKIVQRVLQARHDLFFVVELPALLADFLVNGVRRGLGGFDFVESGRHRMCVPDGPTCVQIGVCDFSMEVFIRPRRLTTRIPELRHMRKSSLRRKSEITTPRSDLKSVSIAALSFNRGSSMFFEIVAETE